MASRFFKRLITFNNPRMLLGIVAFLGFVFVVSGAIAFFAADEQEKLKQEVNFLSRQRTYLLGEMGRLGVELASVSGELDTVRTDDQFVRNQELASEIRQIQVTYRRSVTVYEDIVKLKEKNAKTAALDDLFAEALVQLSQKNYEDASETLQTLTAEISKLEESLAASFTIPANVKTSNDVPPSGYSRQSVEAEGTKYLVDIVAGDLSSTRVIVDTASAGDCHNDCPVLPLAEYVSRNGAFAGINGSYFCPASYPSCADKKNSFDTLLMNKSKVYFNSDNNVYSVVPAVIFLGGSVRFVSKSLEWGRDTGVDSVLANQPLLVTGGNVVFGGDGDPKKGSRGSRSFVANRGNTVYIGVVHNATVAEVARVMKAMGMDNALNLDSGGSIALWYSGYKAGPGRNIPNAILFVRK